MFGSFTPEIEFALIFLHEFSSFNVSAFDFFRVVFSLKKKNCKCNNNKIKSFDVPCFYNELKSIK